MEFESSYDYLACAKAPQVVDLTLEELDTILEVDVVNTVPPPINSTIF